MLLTILNLVKYTCMYSTINCNVQLSPQTSYTCIYITVLPHYFFLFWIDMFNLVNSKRVVEMQF